MGIDSCEVMGERFREGESGSEERRKEWRESTGSDFESSIFVSTANFPFDCKFSPLEILLESFGE